MWLAHPLAFQPSFHDHTHSGAGEAWKRTSLMISLDPLRADKASIAVPICKAEKECWLMLPPGVVVQSRRVTWAARTRDESQGHPHESLYAHPPSLLSLGPESFALSSQRVLLL